MASIGATYADPHLPAVDDRLAPPGTPFEVYDGVLVRVPPSHAPHGRRQAKVAALVEAHAGPDFFVATDMLTRTSEDSDVAPDVSVYPRARDPRTGGRQIEQLAFEVVGKQSLGHAARKADKLATRGVRRVIAIEVARNRAMEWSRSLRAWMLLDPTGQLEDATLAVPVPIAALLSAAKADDAMARALLLKKNPLLDAVREQDRAEAKAEGRAEGRREGLAEGRVEGRAEALLALLDARGVPVQESDRRRILNERDPSRLERWIAQAVTCTDVAELDDA